MASTFLHAEERMSYQEIADELWYNPANRESFAASVASKVTGEIGLRVNVEIMESESLPRFEGKSKRGIEKFLSKRLK
jgi:phenylacetate-coenzyme A ligase PaaK-like adenylate-forming protein